MTSTCPIVGIGASAGGLEALKILFESLMPDTGAAYIVIQHLDPEHKSLTAEILSRSTTMPVVQVTDGMIVEANHVYVIPPNAYLTLSNHMLKLGKAILRHGVRMPIDTFFWSLAEQHEERAVAIIVSGTGSDGALGLRAIKGNGGFILAQTPETAQYDGMPRSAITTGLVDIVCPVNEMSNHLIRYLQHPYIACVINNNQSTKPAEDDEDLIRSIFTLLLNHTGVDFRTYKQGTLSRRIARRISIHQLDSMSAYLEFLRKQPDELDELFKDLLISVTAFFRDADAFDALDANVISALVDKKKPDEPIRVWVAGCASGEEAYSIAMLFMERLDIAHKHCPLQIFATDLDDAALTMGRNGIYPENVSAQVSPARLRRFFTKEDHSYRVTQALRETVTFAVQDVINDPPFSKLDLISCRNFLIYVEPEIQRKVFALFHFSLVDNGFLFLGHSETVSQQEALFDPIVKKWRIYRRSAVVQSPTLTFPVKHRGSRPIATDTPLYVRTTDYARLKEQVQQQLLREYAPAAIVTNLKHKILYFVGPTARYLDQPSGAPTQDLMTLIRHELRKKLRVAFQQVINNGHAVTLKDTYVMRDRTRVPVKVIVTKLMAPQQPEQMLLVTFEDLPVESSASSGVDSGTKISEVFVSQRLEHELQAAQEDLQSHIEEQESANEELQAANEEVMSVNEELQSTNEELETSKEEIQSMNEELTTVNSQLKDKAEQLEKTNNDLSNLLSSTNIATLFLDMELRIGRFTPATKKLLNLIDTDIGRPFSDIKSNFEDGTLLKDAQHVLDTLTPFESELCAKNNEYYLTRILPYRTSDNHICGVVITFIDITERKQSEQQAQLFAAVMHDSNDGVIVQNLDGKIIAWNKGAELMYGWSQEEALAMNNSKMIPKKEHDKEKSVLEKLVNGELVTSYETLRMTKDNRQLLVEHTITRLSDTKGNMYAYAVTDRDISQIKLVEKALRKSEKSYRELVESAPDAMVIINQAGVIEMVNAQAERCFGYSKNELLHMTVEELIPLRFRAQHTENRASYFANPAPREMGSGLELFGLTKDGREFPIEVSLSPQSSDSYAIASIRDITNRKNADALVSSAKHIAETANARKSRFLAAASHDLRQPLQSLTMYLSVLSKAHKEPKTQEIVGKMRHSMKSMSELLDAFLDVSALEAGNMIPEIDDFSLQQLLDPIMADNMPIAEEKGLTIQPVCNPYMIRSDRTLLQRIIENFVSNAIRNTDTGEVRIECPRKGNNVRIEVHDTGKGIQKEKLDSIFEEYVQLENPAREKSKGLGLGLSIAKALAKLLGHRINVSSTPEQGSIFSIEVPLSTGSVQSRDDNNKQLNNKPVRNREKVVLLIDDDVLVLDSVMMLLNEENFLVTTAKDGDEALSHINNGIHPDIVVTDYRLPKQSGIELTKKIREKLNNNIPVIVMTGDMSDVERQAKKLSKVYVQRKPMDVDNFMKIIDNVIA